MSDSSTKSASFNTLLKKKVQAISIAVVLYFLVFVLIFGCYVTVYIISCGSRWMKTCFELYLFYMYFDHDAPNHGGRSGIFMQKLRKWKLWKYISSYFPVKLIKTADLDPSSNYIFCGFPHGLYGYGFGSFVVDCNGCDDMFPGLEFRVLTLNVFFSIPFLRDVVLAFGACSCSQQSIEYLLSTKPQTDKQGRALVLLVGGSEDAFHTRPGVYRIVLKNRKGFVKVALKSGTPLVPVFSFGEIDYYNIIHPPEGSLAAKFRSYMIKKIGIPLSPVIENGDMRHLFLSIKPKRTPIHVVVGSPIKIPKIENPSNLEVDKYHQIFIEKLVELFDSYKETYSQLYNYGKLTLTLV